MFYLLTVTFENKDMFHFHPHTYNGTSQYHNYTFLQFHKCFAKAAFPNNHLSQEKEYIFGRGGGDKVASSLNTELIAELPINRPKFNQDLYEIEEENGKIYDDIAEFIIFKSKN